MVAKYMLVILAVCNIAQASHANILDGSNSKNATADAYEALEKLHQASQAIYPDVVEKINRNLVGIKDDFEKFANDLKEFTIHNMVFSRLQEKAQEKNVDITECLKGKLEEIEGIGAEMIKETEGCTADVYKVCVELKDDLPEILLHKDIERSVHLGLILANECKNDECFNKIVDRAKKELADFKKKYRIIFNLTDGLLSNWRETSRDCFSWSDYWQRTEKTLDEATNCATKKMQ